MKEQCMICGSVVEDVSGVCPVCGAPLNSKQETMQEGSSSGDTGKLQGSMTGMESGGVQSNTSYTMYGSSGNQMQGMPQGNIYTEQMPYNYQNPYQTTNVVMKKKKLFSILSIVLAVLAIVLMCCVSWLSLLCALASVVLGIIALAKKQVKAPAILGLVFGVIAMLGSGIVLSVNLMIKSVIGTDFQGIIEQCFEAQEEGAVSMEGIILEIPGTYTTYTLYLDGTYSDSYRLDYGTYDNYGYMDSVGQDIIGEKAVYAMMEGYELKDVTCLYMAGTGGTAYYIFAIPEDYEPGDIIYYIDGYSTADYRLVPVSTTRTTEYSMPN